jgi:hypothetical protein
MTVRCVCWLFCTELCLRCRCEHDFSHARSHHHARGHLGQGPCSGLKCAEASNVAAFEEKKTSGLLLVHSASAMCVRAMFP